MYLCIPVSSLAEKNETGQTVTPEKGDAVSFTVEGKVSKIENGSLYITPSKINDAKVEPAPATDPDAKTSGADQPGDSSDDPTRAQLLAELQQSDGNMA
jgi:hypothetical protein